MIFLVIATAGASAISEPDLALPTLDDRAFAARTNQAERLIATNRPAEARTLLEVLETQRPKDAQVQFLLGLLDRGNKVYDGAARRFRRILVDNPSAARVRLELALTLFQANDYVGAERQFRFARAGHLPSAVAQNVDRYLAVIRQRKTFSYGFSFAISPDSNLNAGPATDTVTLYGLPFELSSSARQKSGVGVVFDANAEWAPRLAQNLKLRLGAQIHRAQYATPAYNDMTVALYAGPRLNLRRWEFNLTGSAARRWYGNRPYTDMIGTSADATYYLTARVAVGLAASVNYTNYRLNSQQSGHGGTLAANLSFVPTPANLVRGTIQVGRQDARVRAYANNSLLIGAQYLHELKGGFTVGISPSLTRINYDEPLAAFGVTRRDRQFTAQATLLNRRLDLYGLTPRVVYTYTHNDSSIPLYRFSRSRVELGFTSVY